VRKQDYFIKICMAIQVNMYQNIRFALKSK
jgi:hypothetical protein